MHLLSWQPRCVVFKRLIGLNVSYMNCIRPTSKKSWQTDDRGRTCRLLTATSHTSSNCIRRLNCPGLAFVVRVLVSVENEVPLNSDSDLDWTAMKPRSYGTTFRTAPNGILSFFDPLMSYAYTRFIDKLYKTFILLSSTEWSKKVRTGHFLPLTSSNLNRFKKILSLLERVNNVQQASCNTSRHALSMLLHYLRKC